MIEDLLDWHINGQSISNGLIVLEAIYFHLPSFINLLPNAKHFLPYEKKKTNDWWKSIVVIYGRTHFHGLRDFSFFTVNKNLFHLHKIKD